MKMPAGMPARLCGYRARLRGGAGGRAGKALAHLAVRVLKFSEERFEPPTPPPPPRGVVNRGLCLNSGTVSASKITSRRWWCIESLLPSSSNSDVTRKGKRATARYPADGESDPLIIIIIIVIIIIIIIIIMIKHSNDNNYNMISITIIIIDMFAVILIIIIINSCIITTARYPADGESDPLHMMGGAADALAGPLLPDPTYGRVPNTA